MVYDFSKIISDIVKRLRFIVIVELSKFFADYFLLIFKWILVDVGHF